MPKTSDDDGSNLGRWVIGQMKRTHPFVYMCSFFGLLLLVTNGSSNEEINSTIRATSTGSEKNFEMAPLAHIDGTLKGMGDIYDQKGDERLVMYTFYHRIDADRRATGMDDSSDNALLQAWKKRWQAAGWDTRVIHLEHAMQHPRYDEFYAKLQEIPMKGIGGEGKNRPYNELCFLRWLAMGSIGGGWMSDYDMFPLDYGSGTKGPQSVELPNDGDFTVHSIIEGSQGAGIPCLMSGRAEEWTRMAFNILQNGIAHSRDENHWTDMFALMDLRFTQSFKYDDAVIDAQHVLIGREFTKDDCHLTNGKRGIHFSHDAMTLGDVSHLADINNQANHRPLIVEHFLDKWEKVCGHV